MALEVKKVVAGLLMATCVSVWGPMSHIARADDEGAETTSDTEASLINVDDIIDAGGLRAAIVKYLKADEQVRKDTIERIKTDAAEAKSNRDNLRATLKDAQAREKDFVSDEALKAADARVTKQITDGTTALTSGPDSAVSKTAKLVTDLGATLSSFAVTAVQTELTKELTGRITKDKAAVEEARKAALAGAVEKFNKDNVLNPSANLTVSLKDGKLSVTEKQTTAPIPPATTPTVVEVPVDLESGSAQAKKIKESLDSLVSADESVKAKEKILSDDSAKLATAKDRIAKLLAGDPSVSLADADTREALAAVIKALRATDELKADPAKREALSKIEAALKGVNDVVAKLDDLKKYQSKVQDALSDPDKTANGKRALGKKELTAARQDLEKSIADASRVMSKMLLLDRYLGAATPASGKTPDQVADELLKTFEGGKYKHLRSAEAKAADDKAAKDAKDADCLARRQDRLTEEDLKNIKDQAVREALQKVDDRIDNDRKAIALLANQLAGIQTMMGDFGRKLQNNEAMIAAQGEGAMKCSATPGATPMEKVTFLYQEKMALESKKSSTEGEVKRLQAQCAAETQQIQAALAQAQKDGKEIAQPAPPASCTMIQAAEAELDKAKVDIARATSAFEVCNAQKVNPQLDIAAKAAADAAIKDAYKEGQKAAGATGAVTTLAPVVPGQVTAVPGAPVSSQALRSMGGMGGRSYNYGYGRGPGSYGARGGRGYGAYGNGGRNYNYGYGAGGRGVTSRRGGR